MKPPVYKTVTTKEGVMLFVDENALIKVGQYGVNAMGNVFNVHCYNADLNRYQYIIDGALCNVQVDDNLIVAQPINSELDSVPFYELTPQEDLGEFVKRSVVEIEKFSAVRFSYISEKQQAERYFLAGYKAASKKEFTEDDVMKAIVFGFGSCKKSDRAPFDKEIIEFFSSLRQPMKVVSAEPVMNKNICHKCERLGYFYEREDTAAAHTNCNCDNGYAHNHVPETYEKDGKTFIRLTFKYE